MEDLCCRWLNCFFKPHHCSNSIFRGMISYFSAEALVFMLRQKAGKNFTCEASHSWNKGWGSCDRTDFWPLPPVLPSNKRFSLALPAAMALRLQWSCPVLGSSKLASSWEVISASNLGWFKWKVLHYRVISRAASPELPQFSCSCALLPVRLISNQIISRAEAAVVLETWQLARQAWKEASGLWTIRFWICGTELAVGVSQTHRFRSIPVSLESEFASGRVFNSFCFCFGA